MQQLLYMVSEHREKQLVISYFVHQLSGIPIAACTPLLNVSSEERSSPSVYSIRNGDITRWARLGARAEVYVEVLMPLTTISPFRVCGLYKPKQQNNIPSTLSRFRIARKMNTPHPPFINAPRYRKRNLLSTIIILDNRLILLTRLQTFLIQLNCVFV